MGQSALWPARCHRRGAANGIRAQPGECAADASRGSGRGEGTTATSRHESAVGRLIHALLRLSGGVHIRVESCAPVVAIQQYQRQQSEATSTVAAKGSSHWSARAALHCVASRGYSTAPAWRNGPCAYIVESLMLREMVSRLGVFPVQRTAAASSMTDCTTMASVGCGAPWRHPSRLPTRIPASVGLTTVCRQERVRMRER
jgi:hypothetical protein